MASVEEVRAAMARKLNAEADHFTAEAEKFAAEAEVHRETARFARANADGAEVTGRMAVRNEQELMAGNKYHRFYHFTGQVNAEAVRKCMEQLDIWSRMEPGCEIEVCFTSPGGSIIDGMVLFDYIKQVAARGHRVITSTFGMAASMAGILLQAGDHRVMGKESYLLIHEAAFGVQGKTGEVEDTLNFIKKVQSRILGIFADRTKLSRKELEKRWKRQDWWMDSDEALKMGFVDEVRGVAAGGD